MRIVPIYCALVTSALLAACADRPSPTPTEEEKKTGALIVSGAVLNGEDKAIANVPVFVTVYARGCAGDPITAQETQTTGDLLGFRVALERRLLDAVVCIVVTAKPRNASPADSNRVVRDTIDIAQDSVRINPAYDWSRITLRSYLMYSPAVTQSELTSKLMLPTEEEVLQGTGSLPSVRTAGGMGYSVTGIVNGADRIATLTATFTTVKDISQGVDVIVSPKDPTLQCFGCIRKAVVPVTTRSGTLTGDSLFIIWGYNSISQPWVY